MNQDSTRQITQAPSLEAIRGHVAQERSTVLAWSDKAAIAPWYDNAVREVLASRPELHTMSTPVMTLDARILEANASSMAAWCAEHGVDLAPHGKTTMAPAL